MKFVNGGSKYAENVELLSHTFHNPNRNTVCIYMLWQGIKTELTYFKNINTGEEGHEVYFFKGDTLQHYYSRVYSCDKLPKQYNSTAEYLKMVYSNIKWDNLSRN